MSTRTVLGVALAGGIAAVILWFALGEAPQTPEAQVRTALEEIVDGAQAKDLAAILDRISDRFVGQGRYHRDDLKGLLFAQLRRGRWNRILLTDTEVTVHGEDSADVRTFALLARGEGIVPSEADGYSFDLSFAREDDGAWRVVRAEWRPGRRAAAAPTE